MRSDTMTNHTPTTDNPIRELIDAELNSVVGGFGYGNGLVTAVANGASPPATTFLPQPGNAVFGPGYGLTTAVSTGNFPAFGPPLG
jgi:hypothetical protein